MVHKVCVCVCVCDVMSAVPGGWWMNAKGLSPHTSTVATCAVLNSELDSCRELLEEEPRNKCEGDQSLWGAWWCVCCAGCLLTTMLLMATLDPHKHLPEIRDKAHQLMVIDPYRRLYYSDLCECVWCMDPSQCVGGWTHTLIVWVCVRIVGPHQCVGGGGGLISVCGWVGPIQCVDPHQLPSVSGVFVCSESVCTEGISKGVFAWPFPKNHRSLWKGRPLGVTILPVWFWVTVCRDCLDWACRSI